MCRNKTDRRKLVNALKRIANPPESIQGQKAWGKDEQGYFRKLVDYLQTTAETALK